MLPQTVPGTVDERKEGVRCHWRLHETVGVVPHGLWPEIRPFMYPLKTKASAGGVRGVDGKIPTLLQKKILVKPIPFDCGLTVVAPI